MMVVFSFTGLKDCILVTMDNLKRFLLLNNLFKLTFMKEMYYFFFNERFG